jgi:hypothetical protein
MVAGGEGPRQGNGVEGRERGGRGMGLVRWERDGNERERDSDGVAYSIDGGGGGWPERK